MITTLLGAVTEMTAPASSAEQGNTMACFAATDLIHQAVDEKMDRNAFLIACLRRWGTISVAESGELLPKEFSPTTAERIQKIDEELGRIERMDARERLEYAQKLRYETKEAVRRAAETRSQEIALLRGLHEAVLAWHPPAGILGTQLKKYALGELVEALRQNSGPCYASQALQILQATPAIEMLRDHEEELRATRASLQAGLDEQCGVSDEIRAFLAALPATMQAG